MPSPAISVTAPDCASGICGKNPVTRDQTTYRKTKNAIYNINTYIFIDRDLSSSIDLALMASPAAMIRVSFTLPVIFMAFSIKTTTLCTVTVFTRFPKLRNAPMIPSPSSISVLIFLTSEFRMPRLEDMRRLIEVATVSPDS